MECKESGKKQNQLYDSLKRRDKGSPPLLHFFSSKTQNITNVIYRFF